MRDKEGRIGMSVTVCRFLIAQLAGTGLHSSTGCASASDDPVSVFL